MIEEIYVSFDTAKLLKEAGFDVPCNSYYELEDGEVVRKDSIGSSDYNAYEDTVCSRPTQALAARWLREKFGIHIFANYFFEDGTWFYVTVDLKELDEVRVIHPDIRSYQTSEEALEAGLKHCLEQIKK